MKRNLLLGVAFASATLLIQPANIAFAQGPGAAGPAGQTPSTPTTPSTMPGQTGGTPGTMGQTAPDAGGAAGAAAKAPDQKFVKEAAQGGLLEVELGKVASQKASSESVKQFGQKMVDDHTKANDQLKQAASKDNVPVPDTLDAKHQARIDKLSKLSGDAFDKAYVKDQLKDHETDVKQFQAEAQNGTDPDVKAFASSTLPILQQHLEMVKNLSKSTKDEGKSKGQ